MRKGADAMERKDFMEQNEEKFLKLEKLELSPVTAICLFALGMTAMLAFAAGVFIGTF